MLPLSLMQMVVLLLWQAASCCRAATATFDTADTVAKSEGLPWACLPGQMGLLARPDASQVYRQAHQAASQLHDATVHQHVACCC